MRGFSNKQKMIRQSWLTVAVLAFVGTTFFIFDSFMNGQTTEESTLVFSTEVSGITEFSGLTIQSNKQDKLRLSMVGDSSPTVFEVTVDTTNSWTEEIMSLSQDFGSDILRAKATCSSFQSTECKLQKSMLTEDWEGIDSDRSYNFVLQEYSNSVIVLDQKTSKPVATIRLPLPEDPINANLPNFKKVNNSEGVLLLKNGHIAVSKEGNPAGIFEFAPLHDSKPLGVSKSTVLGEGERFNFPVKHLQSSDFPTIEYAPVASWFLSSGKKCDFADLTFSKEDNRLVVLSQKCTSLLYFSPLEKSSTEMKIDKIVKLPDNIKNPEAMGMVNKNLVLVGSDRKKGKNLFLVKIL